MSETSRERRNASGAVKAAIQSYLCDLNGMSIENALKFFEEKGVYLSGGRALSKALETYVDTKDYSISKNVISIFISRAEWANQVTMANRHDGYQVAPAIDMVRSTAAQRRRVNHSGPEHVSDFAFWDTHSRPSKNRT